MNNKTQSPLDEILPNLNRNPFLGKDNELDFWSVPLQTRSLAEVGIVPGDKIVLCVGDSFTFGDDVYYKDTWTSHLQSGIFKEYKVINAGVCGASNTLITNTLSKWCNMYGHQIEYVIIGFSFSQRRTYFSEFNKLALESSVVNLSPGNDWNPQKLDIIKKVNNATDILHTNENDQSDFERNLLLAKGLGKIHKFKTFWWSVDDLGNDDYVSANTNAHLTKESDFVYMNVSSVVNEICEALPSDYLDIDWWSTSSPLRISEDNGHWSVQGHEVLAKGIKKFIGDSELTTWMFGSSTPFSREIIDNLDNPIIFGRHNVNYKDVRSFIDEHVEGYIRNRMDENTPLNIVFNINLGQNASDSELLTESLVKFIDFFHDIGPNIYFCMKLLQELNIRKIPVRVCYTTSTFGNTNSYEKKAHLPERASTNDLFANSFGKDNQTHINSTFRYATTRTMQQLAMTSNISETCRVVGLNPAGINNTNMSSYAKTYAEMLYAPFDDEQWNRIFCLESNVWYSHNTSDAMYEPPAPSIRYKK